MKLVSAGESWLPIAGFPGYEVSDLGNVRSWRKTGTSGIMRDEPVALHGYDSKGYRMVTLRRAGVSCYRMVHGLVLTAFRGPMPTGMQTCHGNGVRDDNRLSNLRWDTSAGNHSDRVLHGTSGRGETNGRSKLTESDVLKLVEMRIGGATFEEAGKAFGVQKAQAIRICKGKQWSHVTGISKGAM